MILNVETEEESSHWRTWKQTTTNPHQTKDKIYAAYMMLVQVVIACSLC